MNRRMVATLLGFALAWMVVPGAARADAQGQARIAALTAKPSLTKPEQQELGLALFQVMIDSKTEDPAFYEKHYLTVIEKCPDTDLAHRSYWRLTNLYLQAYDPPKHKEIVRILEQFLARYKQSTVVSMKKYPDRQLMFSPVKSLHQSYEALGAHAKIAAYYDKIVRQEATFSIYDYFDYASALDKCSRGKDALVWYQKFLTKTRGNDDVEFMREVAADRVKELKSTK